MDAGQYGVNVSPDEYLSSGVRMLRTSDLAEHSLTPDDEGVFLAGPIPEVQVLRENDLLLSRAGTIGRSYLVPPSAAGQTFAGFLIRFRPRVGFDPRFLHYCLRSKWTQDRINAEAVSSTIQNFNAERYAALPVPEASYEEQRRIANFLDDRVARIDQIIAARNKQRSTIQEHLVRASFDMIKGSGEIDRRDSGLPWLGKIPTSWRVLNVGTEFQVDLGKMLDEKRQTGTNQTPYLRNTNVQWDRIDIEDLKSMDIAPEERDRFGVCAGDLLICEGGQPGRAAVWHGDLAPLGFQKALHRARSRGESRPEWLLECLRVAVHLNVFAVENGQTTIAHLTNEQLRSMRLPFPDPSTQDRALEKLRERHEWTRATIAGLGDAIALLQEYKQSLITAAVTGEIDVTTAGSGIPG